MSFRNFKGSNSGAGRLSRQSASAHARRVARGLLVRAARRVARPAGRSMTVARMARQLGRIELKGMDTDIVAAVGSNATPILDTTGTNDQIIPLNLIQQGAASQNRIGRKVSLHSLRLIGRVNLVVGTPSNQPGPNLFRMSLVWDKQPSGQLPLFSDVFGRTDQDGVESTQVLDPLRYDNTDRFRVLMDKRIEMNPKFNPNPTTTVNPLSDPQPAYPAPATGQCTYVVDEYIKLNGRETVFSGQSDPMTIADISSGALYLILRSSSGVASSRILITQFMSRLRYKD